MVRLMDEGSIHDMIKKQVAEEVQRKEDTKEPCRECGIRQATIIALLGETKTHKLTIKRKDADIAELSAELGRIHASMIKWRLNP